MPLSFRRNSKLGFLKGNTLKRLVKKRKVKIVTAMDDSISNFEPLGANSSTRLRSLRGCWSVNYEKTVIWHNLSTYLILQDSSMVQLWRVYYTSVVQPPETSKRKVMDKKEKLHPKMVTYLWPSNTLFTSSSSFTLEKKSSHKISTEYWNSLGKSVILLMRGAWYRFSRDFCDFLNP